MNRQLPLTAKQNPDKLGAGKGGIPPRPGGVRGGTASRYRRATGLTQTTTTCKMCNRYYADWLKTMNIARMKLLRRIHFGGHIHHDDAEQNRH